jgi:hypothetical protein
MRWINVAVTFLLLCGIVQAAPPAVEAEDAAGAGPGAATVKEQASDYQKLVDRIRAVHASGEWKRGDWTDAEIERSLQRLVNDARQASGLKDLQVGTRLAGAMPRAEIKGRLQNSLHVLEGNGDASFADSCVFLVDGNIRISHANNCVIVASGAVEIAHGGANLVVAGHYLHTSHDGSRRPGQEGGRASVLVSGNVLDVSHANGSICSAPGVVRISHANGVTFVNSPNVKASHENGCRTADAAPLSIAPPLKENPLSEKLKVVQLVDGEGDDNARGALAVVEINGVELVLRPGAAIKDGAGKPVEALEGWTLSFVAKDFALFRRASDFAGFVMATPR